MFAFLTGYVCAIKPLRQAKSGNIPAALETLGKSAFRRPPRLIMPATIALLIAWAFAQTGAFEVAHHSDSQWLRNAVPTNIGGLNTEIPRLIRNFRMAWSGANNEYDDHQWALLPLLQGAFLIYVLLFATVFMKFRMRLFTCLVLFWWYWMRTSPEKGTHISIQIPIRKLIPLQRHSSVNSSGALSSATLDLRRVSGIS